MDTEELRSLQEEYVKHGFCYVRGAVAEADVDSLVADLWRKAEVQLSMHWNGRLKKRCIELISRL